LEDPGSSKEVQKRIKPAKFTDLDKAVYKWYKQEHASGINVHGMDIQNATARLAQHLKIQGFNASDGWVFTFRSRHCLVNRKVVVVEHIPIFPIKAAELAGFNLYKYQGECLVVLEDEGDMEVDMRGACTLENHKAHSICIAVFNWAEAWKSLSVTTLTNAWNKLLKDTEVEVDFPEFGTVDFVNLLHRSGETGVSEDNVAEWLEVDKAEQGFRHDTEKEIAASVSDKRQEQDDGDPSPRPNLFDLGFYLDKALRQLPDLKKCYTTIRNIRADVIKCQHTNFKQEKI
ncbi:Tigger transposable element-derived protein 7-like 60, partial [Homarus americanus]